MTFPVFMVAYVTLSVLVGLCGRRRRMGFLGFLVLSLLLTPVLGLFLAYVTQEVPEVEPPRRSAP